MPFEPKLCRNESEVESKLIVQYLLPMLGYSPDNWHQEVAFGSIRLDVLVFAKKFDSFSDVVERVKVIKGKKIEKGISSDRMIAIIDS